VLVPAYNMPLGVAEIPWASVIQLLLVVPLCVCPFQTHVASLVSTKKEKKKNLREDAWRVWREIDDGTLAFQRVEEEVLHSQLLPCPPE